MALRLLNTKISANGLHIAILVIRVVFGVTMLFHGYEKLIDFSTMSSSDFWAKQVNFLGMGGKVSLALVVFAEFFCAIFLILGLFTRPALIILIICMAYAWLFTHKAHIFSKNEQGNIEGIESAFEYVLIYIALLLTGPGKYSIDKLLFK
jgi:putative oxidoreductase